MLARNTDISADDIKHPQYFDSTKFVRSRSILNLVRIVHIGILILSNTSVKRLISLLLFTLISLQALKEKTEFTASNNYLQTTNNYILNLFLFKIPVTMYLVCL